MRKSPIAGHDSETKRRVDLFGAAGFLLFPVAVIGLYALLTVGMIVHELGHACMALLLAPGTVTIEIGQGDRAGSLEVGRFVFMIRREPGIHGLADLALRGWRSGITRLEQGADIGTARHVAIVLAGPLATLLMAALTIATLVVSAARGAAQIWILPDLVLIGFGLCECLAFVGNLTPWRLRQPRHDGAIGTDGYMLLLLLAPRTLRRHVFPPSRSITLGGDGRATIIAAERAAAIRIADAVSPLHLLAGAIEDDGDGMRSAVVALGSDVARVRHLVAQRLGPIREPVTARQVDGLDLSRPAKEVIEQAAVEALRWKHECVESVHMLVGVFIAGSGEALSVLQEANITIAGIRSRMANLPNRGTSTDITA